LEVKGQGHQGQKMHLVLLRPTRLAYEWYALAASGTQQQRATAANERISWQPRGDIGGGLQQYLLGIWNYTRG